MTDKKSCCSGCRTNARERGGIKSIEIVPLTDEEKDRIWYPMPISEQKAVRYAPSITIDFDDPESRKRANEWFDNLFNSIPSND